MNDIYKSCRLCFAVGETSIFDTQQSKEIPLSVKIMVCISIPIMASDNFSKLICSSCKKRVHDFYDFRESCISNYMKLMQFKNSSDLSQVSGTVPDNIEMKQQTLLTDHNICIKNSNINNKLITYDLEEVKICNKGRSDADSNREEDKFHDREILSDLELVDDDTVYNCSFMKKEHYAEDLAFGQEEGDEEDEEDEEEDEVEDEEDYFDSQEDTKPINEDDNPRSLSLLKRYNCPGCILVFPTLKSLSKHLSLCQKDAESKDGAESEEQNSDCELNSEGNKVVQKIVKTNRARWGEKPTYPCPTCGKVFKVPAVLRNHITIHTGERPFLCSLCSRSFRQLGALRNHEMKHNGVSTHPCKLCGKGFFRPSDLEKHIRSHTGERPFMCSICSKAFHQLSGLLVHERIHTGERPYKCSICPMTFNQWANKHRHEKTHAGGAKPYACSVCHHKYSDEKEMKLHQAGHGGGRPHLCQFCKKGFHKPSELRDHLRRAHTNDRPYKCEYCSKRFCVSYELKQHLLVHTGERPFQCTLCTRTFSQKSNLRRHHLRHHKDIPYTQDKMDIIGTMDAVVTGIEEHFEHH